LSFFINFWSFTYPTSASGIAQQEYTISGTISDQKNGETIFGATIMLKETAKGTVSNEYGFYSITTSTPKHTISISYFPQMSVNKLDASTIKKIPVVLGEVDVLKAIQLLPGVTNSGEGSSGFNVRGGAADQNLVLLDEATLYNTSHLFGFFSVFNADAIKDIKLYKGGIPAQFGGRVSSILDAHQKDGNNKEFHANGGIGLISSRLLLSNKR